MWLPVEPQHEQVVSGKDISPAHLTLTACFPTSSSLPAPGFLLLSPRTWLPPPCPVLACHPCRRAPERWEPETAAGLESETLTIHTRPLSATSRLSCSRLTS